MYTILNSKLKKVNSARLPFDANIHGPQRPNKPAVTRETLRENIINSNEI